jgi:hypothetical protein
MKIQKKRRYRIHSKHSTNFSCDTVIKKKLRKEVVGGEQSGQGGELQNKNEKKYNHAGKEV